MNELQIETFPLLIGGGCVVFAFVYVGVRAWLECQTLKGCDEK